MAAAQDPEFRSVVAEYTAASKNGLWDTTTVLLSEQLSDLLDSAPKATNKAAIEKTVGSLPWLKQACSDAQKKWAAEVVARKVAAKEHKPLLAPGASKRKQEVQDAVAQAAKKFKSEALEKEKKKEDDKKALVVEAAVEYMKAECGKKAKKTVATAMAEKLKKACRCHLTLAHGHHKETCVFYPPNLKTTLATLAVKRAALAKQLEGTSMTPGQCTAALDMMFGPSGGSASSSSSGAT